MPPCSTRDEPADVAQPKSRRSTSATERPRSAASWAIAAPVMPPPTTTISKRPLRSRFRFRCICLRGRGHQLLVYGLEPLDLNAPRKLLFGPPAQRRAAACAQPGVAEQHDQL